MCATEDSATPPEQPPRGDTQTVHRERVSARDRDARDGESHIPQRMWNHMSLYIPLSSKSRNVGRQLSARPTARRAHRTAPAVSMGVPSFYAWVKKRYPLMVEHVHHTCSDSPDGQAGADSVS